VEVSKVRGKLFVISLVFSLFFITPKTRSWNEQSRMALIAALVENHTFSIDSTDFVSETGDKVFINGHFYSDKAPLPSFFGVPVYFLLNKLGLKLRLGWNLAYYLLTFFVIKLFALLGLFFFYRLLSLIGVNRSEAIFLTFVLAFGSLYFTWTTVYNNHLLVASHLILALYFLIRAKLGYKVNLNLFLSGIFFAAAVAEDLTVSLVFSVFFAYTIWKFRRPDAVLIFGAPQFLFLLPTFLYFYHISGRFVPFQVVPSYFIYPGSPWLHRTEILSGVSINKGWFLAKYSFLLLFGKKGFLLYNPLLFLAIPSTLHEIKSSGRFKDLAIAVLVAVCLYIGYYMLYTNNYSGASYSIRWFVIMIPLFYIFFYNGWWCSKSWKARLFKGLFFLSIVITLIGALNPYSTLVFNPLPPIDNIYELLDFIGKYFL
jgi:hypothetical protein